MKNEVIDGLVAQLEGVEVVYGQVMKDIYWTTLDRRYVEEINDPTNWAPTQYWEQGGPIIERERIEIVWRGDNWVANPSFEYETGVQWANGEDGSYTGPTPLIAAMRCYVASKLKERVMKLNNSIVGKTVSSATFVDSDLIVIRFTDGNTLYIKETQQAGQLGVGFNQAVEVKPDNYEGETE